MGLGRFPEAEQAYRRALELDRSVHGETDPEVAIDLN